MRGQASAPASSANLGPGFDLLAIALQPRCVVVAEPAARWSIAEDGVTYEPESTSFVRAAIAAATDGVFHLVIDNAVPRARGLGSSAAVVASAIAAAIRAGGREPSREELYAATTAADGHPDNAAATVYGGLVVGTGEVPHRLEVAPSIEVVMGIPDQQLSTEDARAALAASVDRGVAVRSLSRLACLIEGLRLADRRLLAGAGGDELHEAPRARLSPVTTRLIDAALDAGAWHAAWSGAGPSAIAFCSGTESADVEAAMIAVLAGEGEVLRPSIDVEGLR